MKAGWNSLWLNGSIATMSGPNAYGLIADGAIAAQDGRIAWVGPRARLPDRPERCASEIIDLDGNLVTPGLIDAHTHLVYAGNRAAEFEARIAGRTYEEIARTGGGIRATVAATRAATFEELFEQSASRLEAMCALGVTTVEIKSGYGLDVETELRMLRVARELGRRFPVDVRTTYLGAHSLPQEYEGRRDAYLRLVCDVVTEGVREGLIDAVDAFCEKIAFTVDEIRRVFACARDLSVPVKLHAGQIGLSDGPELAADFRALSVDHLEHVSQRNIVALAKAGVIVVLLPTASYFIGDGAVPPIESFRESGLKMAVATDCNPGTSPNVSLLIAMNMACVRYGLTCEEALLGATSHAALALGMAKTIGTLEVGKFADLAIWEAQHPAELPYSFGQTKCCGVHKRGRPSRSYQGRSLTGARL